MPAVNHAQPHRVKAIPRLLSIKQATFELGLSRTSTYELIADGKLKTVKIGRRRFVTIEAMSPTRRLPVPQLTGSLMPTLRRLTSSPFSRSPARAGCG